MTDFTIPTNEPSKQQYKPLAQTSERMQYLLFSSSINAAAAILAFQKSPINHLPAKK